MHVIRRHFLLCGHGPSCQPLHAHSTSDGVVVDHVDHAAPSTSKVVDDGEAPDSNEPEMGRRGSRVAGEEVYEG